MLIVRNRLPGVADAAWLAAVVARTATVAAMVWNAGAIPRRNAFVRYVAAPYDPAPIATVLAV